MDVLEPERLQLRDRPSAGTRLRFASRGPRTDFRGQPLDDVERDFVPKRCVAQPFGLACAILGTRRRSEQQEGEEGDCEQGLLHAGALAESEGRVKAGIRHRISGA